MGLNNNGRVSPLEGPAPVSRPFTGKHITAILVACFGVVIAVNFTMASLASSTFGAEVVENSYVASQSFNRWLDEAEAEEALGWKLSASRRQDGRIVAMLSAVPGQPTVTAVARHPLGRRPDTSLTFVRDASGTWVSRQVLPEGRWTLRFDVTAQGKTWRDEEEVQ